MNKFLLFAFSLCGVSALNAMEPLTPEQLAAFTCQVDMNEDGSFYRSSADVHMKYADGSNTQIKIPNFNYGDDSDVQTLYVDWATGTVSIMAMYYGYQQYDEDTNSYYYNFAVNPEAAELSGPMDPTFTQSKIVGTISEDGIVLLPWMLVKVANNFQSMEKGFTQPITTKYVKPNATMSVKRLEWDSDYENLIPYSQVDLDGAEYPDKRIYTEIKDTDVTIYHWDDNPSCVVFNQKIEAGNTYYTTPADRTIYMHRGRTPYVLCQLPGYTWDDIDGLSAENAVSVVSEAVTDSKKLSFGSWTTINLGASYNNERTFASACTVTFDNPLPVGASGLTENVATEVPVKVTYFNLYGIETVNPENGIFIKVATYSDGERKATKIVK